MVGDKSGVDQDLGEMDAEEDFVFPPAERKLEPISKFQTAVDPL
jgi:hypothetical protein